MAIQMSISADDAPLSRQQTAAALTAAGYPTGATTLAVRAWQCRASVFKDGPKAIYVWSELPDWPRLMRAGPQPVAAEAPPGSDDSGTP